jgi:hypothetical protein
LHSNLREGEWVIGVEPVEATFVRLVIEEVYPGNKCDDTCLAEIDVWGVVKRRVVPSALEWPAVLL